MTKARLGEETRGIDGCSIPTYAIPLRSLAFGFARFATGEARAIPRERSGADPGGGGRPSGDGGRGRAVDTEIMTVLGARAFTKTGAEGVFCAALPERGLGLAVKADDGGARAAQLAIAALIQRFGGFDEDVRASLAPFVAPRLANWNGVETGVLRPAGPLA